MVAAEVEITNPTGLHTRPGKQFVQEAKGFVCDIRVKKGDAEANAKSLMKMLKIGVSQGDRITIECDGEDEEVALTALTDFVAALTD